MLEKPFTRRTAIAAFVGAGGLIGTMMLGGCAQQESATSDTGGRFFCCMGDAG